MTGCNSAPTSTYLTREYATIRVRFTFSVTCHDGHTHAKPGDETVTSSLFTERRERAPIEARWRFR